MPQSGGPHDALRDALRGAEPPASLAGLDDAVVADLADAIVAARREQARQLAASGEKSLAVIPRLLRGPVKKMLGM